MKIIDSHIHIWDFDRAEYPWLKGDTTILNRSYHMEELTKEKEQTNILYGVLVQATNNFEDTDHMLHVAAQTEWIKGVVGWLPLQDPEVAKSFLNKKYLQNPYFKGVRHLIHNENDPKWLLQEKVLKSLKFLAENEIPFDVVGVLPEHIKTTIEVAKRIPKLRMVLDHMSQPPLQQNLKFGRWGDLIQEASEFKNLHVKISGLGTTSGKPNLWNESDIKDYVELVLKTFGIQRCFCGGDWPVSLLAGSYQYTWQQYKNTLEGLLNEEDFHKVIFQNANEFYNLNLKN